MNSKMSTVMGIPATRLEVLSVLSKNNRKKNIQMKKLFIGSSQIVSFWVIYGALSFLGICIVAFVFATTSWIFGSNGEGTLNRAAETLVYTITP